MSKLKILIPAGITEIDPAGIESPRDRAPSPISIFVKNLYSNR
jgi:hypothetical protein